MDRKRSSSAVGWNGSWCRRSREDELDWGKEKVGVTAQTQHPSIPQAHCKPSRPRVGAPQTTQEGVSAPFHPTPFHLPTQWSWEYWSHSQRTGGKQVTIFCRQPWRGTGKDGKTAWPCAGGDLQQQAVGADSHSGSRPHSRKPSLIRRSPSLGQSVVATERSQPTNNSGILLGGRSPRSHTQP